MAGATPEGKLLDIIKQGQGKLKLKKELKVFTKINIILAGLMIIILAVFLIDVFTITHTIPELSVNLPEEKEDILPRPRSFDEDEEDMDVVKKPVSISKEEILKDLTLLGIITGEDNQAIIEDKKTKKTQFLYKGDSIGDLKVIDIKDSEVMLDYNGERIELRI
ncbi:MAG: hypothetical protein KKG01_01515 [Candidatus Omnitrophica bacterium]|nr:hypothetical protein [Candidatus Omnitrophota bacterium]